MTGTPPRLPPPSSPALLPTLAAVTYLALIVALWGVLSVVLDRDVVDYPDASPLLGPTMAGLAVIVTWVVLLRTRSARTPWPGTLLAAFGTLTVMLIAAVVGYAPSAAAHFALSPFVLGAAALAGVVALGVWALHPMRR